MKTPQRLIAYIAVTLSLVSGSVHAVVGDRVGDEIHNFAFVAPDGVTTTLSDYRGEVIVVKLWATWCGVCRVKWPTYQALYEAVSDVPGVRLVTLSIFEEPADSQAWVESKGYTVPLYRNLITDKGAVSVAGDAEYFIKGTPTVFLIDKSGVIKKKSLGFNGDITEADIRSLL